MDAIPTRLELESRSYSLFAASSNYGPLTYSRLPITPQWDSRVDWSLLLSLRTRLLVEYPVMCLSAERITFARLVDSKISYRMPSSLLRCFRLTVQSALQSSVTSQIMWCILRHPQLDISSPALELAFPNMGVIGSDVGILQQLTTLWILCLCSTNCVIKYVVPYCYYALWSLQGESSSSSFRTIATPRQSFTIF